MTHWFHRNPLKATAPVPFNFYGVASTPAASKICSELRTSRARLLELFTDASCNVEMMKNATDSYLSLLQGFITSLDGSTQDNKLRYIQNFKWTDTLQGNVPSSQQDAVFELVSMGFNVALWHTKFASRLAGKEDITEDEAKDVHRSLKFAAGIFKHLKESHIPKLITPAEKGRDLEARVIDAYIIQCQAEAQEVTIARAIELKHNPGLIAALANETANYYQKVDHTLSSLEPVYIAKWRKYTELKMCFYMAYSFCYHGQTLLASDKCGEAIRSLQEAEKFYSKAEALCKEYGETKGPGTTAKPSGHLFFRKLGSLVKNTLDKCQRENGFIYFQKVPPEAPQLELKANYGLVEPIPFEFPSVNPQWTPETLAAFDLTKRPKDDSAKPHKEEEVKPMKEADIKPQKDSGCQIS
ncbi:BRO1 domain-containing protein BROX [Rhinatrema bivittatum]|uniref:BRO1 domain-containing protein BROX n=1 Tax=Rhinatrema bivittatum TaxID=194408 RepID=UPI00112A60AE|nr:BRO1 domain-containing protein BROX [Rhinatrema bivittatum]XP_029448992.1 BRO1 domain-containing protein BROX [Rhinatrema bivittatum]XP_029448993.1 BRO1 domain-containing protein BROX [Rhinatrema bivittatum]XP_029448994.1 BRO1 domain-containing protein BROX [Rhinatrema bivittatum]XP_029448995.1 BRO1 domain-containing protein BROX [Rhinatrema bivittatum]XP_029448996.1 BRO1 domain-containing protein BROX [Rhinatrema bivittatum]XP_029448997.1 BRO1 domain-containing protein BROX [Rhinatrema bi